MRNVLILTAAALALVACNPSEPATTATGTATSADHAAMGHDAAATPGDAAFAASETQMHALMADASGNTLDESYIAKMIAYHQGAIAMADIALAQSQDPEIRRMAQTVKDTQTVEIAEMQAWEAAPPAPAIPPASAPAATSTPASPQAAAN